jgi:predicted GIY-YIG superfamily endonuclease
MSTDRAKKPTYLYRCFDQHGVLLYAGISDDPERRMKEHAIEKFWWGDVAKTTNMAFKTRERALWAEWAVIATCHPLHNASVSPPPDHRCPSPPAPAAAPLPIEGYIYTRKMLAEVEARSWDFRVLHQEMDQLFIDAGVQQ